MMGPGPVVGAGEEGVLAVTPSLSAIGATKQAQPPENGALGPETGAGIAPAAVTLA
jgi:hypothetical protein